jgi:inorganic pyrophosphatase/exopolyphosphatase
LWVDLGGRRYPDEALNLDWANVDYCLAYDAYQDFKRIFIKTDSIPYIGTKDFKNVYPIYSVDLTDQPRKITDTKSNIILRVEFNEHVQEPTGNDEGTVCYVVVDPNLCFFTNPLKIELLKKNN